MGLELALILGVMGTVWTGNPLSANPGFSIGAPPTGGAGQNILGNLGGLLGMYLQHPNLHLVARDAHAVMTCRQTTRTVGIPQLDRVGFVADPR